MSSRLTRARIAAAAGDSATALALLDQVHWSRVSRVAAAEPLDRLLHADLLAAVGRYGDAMQWYSTLGSGTAQELPLLGFATLGMARTSERTGDRASAVKYYRQLIELWRDADPPLQAMVATAERKIAALNLATTR